MTRSRKKAITTISRRMADNAHSIARHRVKEQLAHIDPVEPDELTLLDIEADIRKMGLEDYGTKIGWEYDSLKECDTWEPEEAERFRDKERRK